MDDTTCYAVMMKIEKIHTMIEGKELKMSNHDLCSQNVLFYR